MFLLLARRGKPNRKLRRTYARGGSRGEYGHGGAWGGRDRMGDHGVVHGAGAGYAG